MTSVSYLLIFTTTFHALLCIVSMLPHFFKYVLKFDLIVRHDCLIIILKLEWLVWDFWLCSRCFFVWRQCCPVFGLVLSMCVTYLFIHDSLWIWLAIQMCNSDYDSFLFLMSLLACTRDFEGDFQWTHLFCVPLYLQDTTLFFILICLVSLFEKCICTLLVGFSGLWLFLQVYYSNMSDAHSDFIIYFHADDAWCLYHLPYFWLCLLLDASLREVSVLYHLLALFTDYYPFGIISWTDLQFPHFFLFWCYEK